MVIDKNARLDRAFRALAHPARRAMLKQLASEECNLSALAAPLKMTFPAALKHVRTLERAGLVKRRVHGREHTCRLDPGPLDEAVDWTRKCREVWEANFRRLDDVLAELVTERKAKPKA